MRILLDAYNMGLQHGTGVATYGRNLSAALKQAGCTVDVLYGARSTRRRSGLMSEVAFFDAAKPRRGGALRQLSRHGAAFSAPFGCDVDPIPIGGQVVIEAMRSRLPAFDHLWNSEEFYQRAIRSHRMINAFARIAGPPVDLAHWTYPVPAFHSAAPNIYTLHDLVPLRLPHTTLDNKVKYFAMCRRIVADAAHIVTVSENSRRDIIDLLGADPARVSNTWQSVGFPTELIAESDATVATRLRGTFDLDHKGYFLFYGALEPKKNIGRLVEAYLGSGVDTPLVIVGAPGWGSESEVRLLETVLKLPGNTAGRRIVQLEYLPLSLLVPVIRGARATLFPSLYEGFGLPVVESMLLGTAVLTSTTSCLPEIAGDAALLVDPYDTTAIASAIVALDGDPALRQRLEALGRERARLFDAASYATRVTSIYAATLASAGRRREGKRSS